MLGGIKEILIITTPEDNPILKTLGDGKGLGLNIQYETQEALMESQKLF